MKMRLMTALIGLSCAGAAGASGEVTSVEDLKKITVLEAPPGTIKTCRGKHCAVTVHVVSTGPISGPNGGHYVCRTFLDYHKVVVTNSDSVVRWTLRRAQGTDDADYGFVEIKPGDIAFLPSLALHGINLDSTQNEFDDGRIDGRRYRWHAAKGRGTEINYLIIVAQYRKGVMQGYCEPNDPVIVNQS